MNLTIITLPLLASLTALMAGRKIGKSGVQYITTGSVIIAAGMAIIMIVNMITLPDQCSPWEKGSEDGSFVNPRRPQITDYGPGVITIIPWIDNIDYIINISFYYDTISIIMCVVILTISAAVHIYSSEYMSEDPHQQRYYGYLSLFTFFMLILVMSDNYLLLFVGWEGVGVASYLLINFWFTRIQANKSAMQAILMNRIGDWGLILAIILIFLTNGNNDYISLETTNLSPEGGSLVMSGAACRTDLAESTHGIPVRDPGPSASGPLTILLLIAAIGKSAQLGLHTWLPSAMEGPTPVSALIHAATMVTAGVYLIIWSSIIFDKSPTILLTITVLGSLTAIFAATIGLYQNDIKRVIAYSTCSQLGYMVLALGCQKYEVALYHLLNHAYFKALLFLSAGSIIHATSDEQDLWKMGGLVGQTPFTYIMTLIGSLSLMALPFLSGYYSKDIILEISSGQLRVTGTFTYWLGTITATITALYSTTSLIKCYGGSPNLSFRKASNCSEVPPTMAGTLFVLGILSIIIGYISKDFFTGCGTTVPAALDPSVVGAAPLYGELPAGQSPLDSRPSVPGPGGYDYEYRAVPLYYQYYPLLATLLGLAAAILAAGPALLGVRKGRGLGSPGGRSYQPYPSTTVVTITRYLNQRYYIDLLYNNIIISVLVINSGIISQSMDKGFLTLLGPHGLRHILLGRARYLAFRTDTGYLPHYTIAFIIYIIIILRLSFTF